MTNPNDMKPNTTNMMMLIGRFHAVVSSRSGMASMREFTLYLPERMQTMIRPKRQRVPAQRVSMQPESHRLNSA